jgi:hypothetical protein
VECQDGTGVVDADGEDGADTGSLRGLQGQVFVPGVSESRMLFERDVLVPAWDGAEKNVVRLFSVAQWSQVTMDDELLAGQLNYGKREFNH